MIPARITYRRNVMATVYDAPPEELIAEMSEKLKGIKQIEPPQWAGFVKTGASRKKMPSQKDWWYVRAASLLRKVYLHGPVGIPTLRRWYGGRKNRGHKPDAVRGGSGSVIKNMLVQLEEAGLVEKSREGRKVTPEGAALLDKVSAKLIKAS